MSRPDQGAISALWAGTAPDARMGGYEQGSYFTEAKEEGKETNEAQDQEVSSLRARACGGSRRRRGKADPPRASQLIDNFYINSEKIIQKVTGDGLGPWKA